MKNTVKYFDFNKLFILDLANNHQGDFAHGIDIISQLGEALKDKPIKPVIKFQFRQIDTFIHPDYKTRDDLPHIPRLMSTRLGLEEYEQLIAEAKKWGMMTCCTPFDEESVDLIKQMDFDIIKVASCSISDWPLIDKIIDAKMPIVASTGGISLSKIDEVVHHFKKNKADFAIHHCVSIYPTPIADYNLNQIGLLSKRYRDVPIGWSTHEDPDDYTAVQLATAKGAVLFERHVGLNTKKHKLNAYSSNPEQVSLWVDAYLKGLSALGSKQRSPSKLVERESIESLVRGVYANKSLTKGDAIKRDDVFFAMPYISGGMGSGQWVEGLIADKDYGVNEPVDKDIIEAVIRRDPVPGIRNQLIGMLNDANIVIDSGSTVELSHHYGLDNFREHGAIIIDVVNRDYCKKLIIQFPRQKHPYHYHKRKEETFQVLHGEMTAERDGEPTELIAGDLFLVEPGHWHKFSTLNGCIFEEISTTHYNDDSIYEDEIIASAPREKRKTKITL
jgi:sialic acid synthase SpsE/mannose-6-phosphate isomerase-like protein (cupin superfamily)